MSAPSAPSTEADEAEFAAHDAGAGLADRLRFNSAIKFGRLHIIPRLPLFLAAHPKLTVEAVLDDREVDLIEEGIDVGFRLGMFSDSAIVARKIGQSRRRVFGAWAFQADLNNGRVKRILPGWTLPSLDLWAAFLTGRRASTKARACAAFIEKQLRETSFAEQPARWASMPPVNRSTA